MSNFDTVKKIPEPLKEFSVTCYWSFMQYLAPVAAVLIGLYP